MSWENILKIKTPNGEYLIVRDVEKFKRRLREELRIVSLPFYGFAGNRSENPNQRRASNVVVKDKWIETDYSNRLEIWSSVRNPKTRTREYITTILEENDEGDFVFLTVMGAGINLDANSIMHNEKELIEAIGKGVERFLEEEE
tara:strand:+ start:77 stop:508 length:432 start_codon:yes stop_codon:yes gene_type:complete